MKPTEILMSEHRVIEQVLNCLEKMADGCEAERRLDAAAARDAVRFFREFADKCHHGKEESELFPMMETRGFSPDCGPTAAMRAEHVIGRNFIKGMDKAIDGAAAGRAENVDEFLENARGYLHLLREHIQKEDHCLFPMANQALNDADQEQLSERFERVEREDIGEGVHEELHRIADGLAHKFGVERAAAHASGRHTHG